MNQLNVPAAIDAARQMGMDFVVYRDALAAVVSSTRDRDALVEALTRDLLAAAVGQEARSMYRTMTILGATDGDARAIVASFIAGVSTIIPKEASA